MEFQAVLDAVRSLPVDDQVRLVDLIQDDLLAKDDDPSLNPELIKELQRRLADIEANPNDSIPWEEVRTEAHARPNHRSRAE